MNMKKTRILFWGSFLGGIALVGLIVLILSISQGNRMEKLEKMFPNWVSAEGTIASFQAKFPQEPEYASQEIPFTDSEGSIQQEIFVSGSENMSYFVSSAVYPVPLEGEEEALLRQSLGGMVQTFTEGEVISSNYVVPLSGPNYLEFEIHNIADDVFVRGRLFTASQALYQVYATYSKPAYNDDEYTYFVNSFAIQ